MPRHARVILPNHPHHIIHRGHNRRTVFSTDRDFVAYLDVLREWKTELGCLVYSYCLMTNHVHLVIDPGDEPLHLSQLMKRLAGRYTRYLNKRTSRTGTAWEGRFRSSPIETDSYLLACCRYVELNPVRAGMVTAPHLYRWSSYNAKIGRRREDWLDEDPCYRGLGRTRRQREPRYREWIRASCPASEWDLIRKAVCRGQLTGDTQFIDRVERELGLRIEPRAPGRPRKARVRSRK